MKEDGLIGEDRFFRLVSSQCDYMDEETIKSVYMAVVRVISKDLKENEIARIPHIGDLVMVEKTARMGLVGKTRVMMPESKVVKFYIDEMFRRHINEWTKANKI